MIPIRRESGSLIFEVTVLPRSSRVAIEGEFNGTLSVRLTDPPVEGSANKKCAEVLSKALGIPQSALGVVSGNSSRCKRVCILHEDVSVIEEELAVLPGDLFE